MSVASILASKENAEVLTVTADLPISKAVAMLAEKKVGALVVVEGKSVCGILSERDVVRGLGAAGPAVMTQTVASLMTAEVSTCTRSDTIDSVMRKMTDGRFRHMPVVEGGELVGVISIGDVVKHRIAALQHEAEALRDYVMS